MNVLATFVRQGGGSLNEAQNLWQVANWLLNNKAQEVRWGMALELAARQDISAYDAQFVVLARQHNVDLVTGDSRLRQRFPDETISLDDF